MCWFCLINLSDAGGAELFAAPAGSGSMCAQAQPCSLSDAVLLAKEKDTVYVAQGTYQGTGAAVVSIDKTITVYGGWDGAPTGPIVRNRVSYPSILDGENARRVIYISGSISPAIDGFTIRAGNASGLGGGPNGADAGGGICSLDASPTLRNNIITNNLASAVEDKLGWGGGAYIKTASAPALITLNEFRANTAMSGEIGLGNGGGLSLWGPASVLDNLFFDNTAKASYWSQGGGLHVFCGEDQVLISGNQFEGNLGLYGGAIYLYRSKVTVRSNSMKNNSGSTIQAWYDFGSLIEKNVIYGPGLYLQVSQVATKIHNNIIVSDNTSAVIDAHSDSSFDGYVELIHNTLVSKAGKGVAVGKRTQATLLNNILTGHSVGIETRDDGSVQVDHSLFWQNTHDGIRGTNPVDGDPCFVDSANEDYHIGGLSWAKDAAASSAVMVDFEGEERPAGAGPDIGADEYHPIVYIEPSGNCGGKDPCYSLLSEAFVNAEDGAVIMAASGNYDGGAEGFVFNRNASFSLLGGLDPADFSQTSSPTILNGLEIRSGRLVLQNIHLKAF